MVVISSRSIPQLSTNDILDLVFDGCHFKQVNTVFSLCLPNLTVFVGWHFKQVNTLPTQIYIVDFVSGGSHFKQVNTKNCLYFFIWRSFRWLSFQAGQYHPNDLANDIVGFRWLSFQAVKYLIDSPRCSLSSFRWLTFQAGKYQLKSEIK